MRQLPYESSMDALVYLADYDKKEREKLEREERERRQRMITFPELLEDVCRVFKIPVKHVMGKRRYTELEVCKKIFCYVACVKIINNPRLVGEYLRIDRTSVIHHRDTVNWFLEKGDPGFLGDWWKFLNNSSLFKPADFPF